MARGLFTKKLLAVLLAIAAQSALAQPVLEELVVTATKRAVNEMDTPLSMEAVTGDRIEETGIRDLADISTIIPNVHINEGYTAGSVNIRGMGSGTDRGFEQSVALFVDDVYQPRSRQYRASFFDMERVEVMRGPQAVLFGLNATAGTINVFSAKTLPGDENFLKVTAGYESEYSGHTVSAVAGGTLGERAGIRLAVEQSDSGDGWYENIATGEDETWNENTTVRLTGVFDVTDDLRVTAKFENAEADTLGDITEGYGATNQAIGGGPDLDWVRNSSVVSLRGLTDDHGFFVESDNFVLNAEYTMENHVLTAILGYSDSETTMATTAQVTPEGGAQLYIEEYEQTSFELRLASSTDGAFSYIAGLYVSESDNLQHYDTNFGPFLLGAPGLSLIRGHKNNIDTDVLSVYFSGTYEVSDHLRVTAGLRYSDEEKSSDTLGVRPDNGGDCGFYISDGTGNFTFAAPFPCTAAEFPKDTRSSDNLMPEIIVQYDFNDDMVGYAKANRSAKSGGFATSASVAPNAFEYDDEIATAFEIGLKTRFWGGRGEVNAAIFHTTFEDLQVNTFVRDPNDPANFISGIDNAAELTSQGIELEVNLAATERLTVGAAVGYLDAEYEEYDGANCYPGEASDSPTIPGQCDKSGEDSPFAPELSGSIFADFYLPVSDKINLAGGITMAFSSEYFTNGVLDPTAEQDSYERFDARIGLVSADDKWSVRLIGKNLNDEAVLGVTQDIVGHVGFINAPRTVTLQGTYNF